MRSTKRPVRVLAAAAGVVLLLILAGLVTCFGVRPGKVHASPSPSPVGQVTASPSARPTLRAPLPINTPPPTATPFIGGVGKG